MKNQVAIKKIIWGLIASLNAIFLVYYCGLAVNMRLHYDDIHFLYCAQEQNLWDYLDWVWFDRSGRMTVYAMNWIFSTITNHVGVYWFWPILYMGFGWLLCWIFVRELPIVISTVKKWMLLIMVYNLYILTAVDFAVFYWPCAMQYYIIGPATLAIMGYAIRKEMKWYQWVMAIFVVGLVGFGYEYWIPMALLMLFFVGLCYWKEQQWNIAKTWEKPQVKRVVLFAVLLVIGFLTITSAPGMHRRVEDGAIDEGMVHPEGLVAMCKAYAKVLGTLIYFQLFYLPYYIVLGLVTMYVGARAEDRIAETGKIIKWLSVAVASVILVACVEPAYIYGGFGIQRFYTPLILLMVLYFAAMGYLIGHKCARLKESKWLSGGSMTGLVVMCAIMVTNIVIDFPISKRYADAVDARKEYLFKMRDEGYTGVLELEQIECPYTIDTKYVFFKPLDKKTPRPAIYYYSDVEDPPTEYSKYVPKAFHLNFEIKCKKIESE